MMDELKKNMGRTALDVVTGFEGTITGIATYLTGCDQYCITAKAKDNFTEVRCGWYDINRVTVDKGRAKLVLETEVDKGAMTPPSTY